MIRGDARLPLRCIGVVRQAPIMCVQCLAGSGQHLIPADTRHAYGELYAHWRRRGFHCADAVFAGCNTTAAPAELSDAVTAFMGGTLFTGMTCGALSAGVMALGLALGEIEDSRRRVAWMIATMAAGGNAFANDLNVFNRVMNLGQDLAEWFEAEFGSTRCKTLTGCDFATIEGVHAYVEHDGTSACARIARRVAEHAADMLRANRPDTPGDGSA